MTLLKFGNTNGNVDDCDGNCTGDDVVGDDVGFNISLVYDFIAIGGNIYDLKYNCSFCNLLLLSLAFLLF